LIGATAKLRFGNLKNKSLLADGAQAFLFTQQCVISSRTQDIPKINDAFAISTAHFGV
jgi:hypothetical protein